MYAAASGKNSEQTIVSTSPMMPIRHQAAHDLVLGTLHNAAASEAGKLEAELSQQGLEPAGAQRPVPFAAQALTLR